MQATALKDEAISLLDSLSAEQVRYVLDVIRSLPQGESAARKCSLRGRFASYADPALRAEEKDAWSRAAAEKALSELEGMTFSPKAETSMDGRAERAQALWRKYESLP